MSIKMFIAILLHFRNVLAPKINSQIES